MAISLPNGATFDMAASYSSDIEVTISNAATAVVSTTAHSLVEGDYVLILNSSWVKLDKRVFLVGTVVAGTSFELVDVDTSDTVRFPAGGVATVRPVATWVQIPQILEVDSSGGEQQFINYQFLEDDAERQMPTSKSATSLTLEVAFDPTQPFVKIIEEYDGSRDTHAFKLNLVNGNTFLYPAIPSITATPTLSVNNLMTRTISLAVQGRISRYAPAQ